MALFPKSRGVAETTVVCHDRHTGPSQLLQCWPSLYDVYHRTMPKLDLFNCDLFDHYEMLLPPYSCTCLYLELGILGAALFRVQIYFILY